MGYNSVVSHFIRGHSDNCTFCDVVENPEPSRENALHLFYHCNITEQVSNNFFTQLLGQQTIVTRQELFVEFTRFDNNTNNILFIISKIFLKFIWECKVRKCLPTTEIALQTLKFELKCLTDINRSVKQQLERSIVTLNQRP